jgi:hypothetical protein
MDDPVVQIVDRDEQDVGPSPGAAILRHGSLAQYAGGKRRTDAAKKAPSVHRPAHSKLAV